MGVSWAIFIITGVSIYGRGMLGRHEITWEMVAAFSARLGAGKRGGVGKGMGEMKSMFTGGVVS